jgi:hypothetical protein
MSSSGPRPHGASATVAVADRSYFETQRAALIGEIAVVSLRRSLLCLDL